MTKLKRKQNKYNSRNLLAYLKVHSKISKLSSDKTSKVQIRLFLIEKIGLAHVTGKSIDIKKKKKRNLKIRLVSSNPLISIVKKTIKKIIKKLLDAVIERTRLEDRITK